MKDLFRTVLIFIFTAFLITESWAAPSAIQDTTLTLSNSFTALRVSEQQLDNFINFIQKEDIKNKEAAHIRTFYKNRNNQYAWFIEEGLTEQTQSFWNLYEQFLNYSGDSSLYNSDLHQRVGYMMESDDAFSPSDPNIVVTELRLTKLFLDFIDRAYTGKVNPAKVQWHIPKKKVNAVELLDEFVSNRGKDINDWLPANKQYIAMRERLLRFQKLQGQEWPQISLGDKKVYKLGDSAAVVSELKNRLYILGDLATQDRSTLYDNAMEAAVIAFQRRHGLDDDGIVGPAVMRAINIPIEQKIEQMLINMERMRWMPEQTTGKRVVVNIPEFRLHVYEGNKDVLSMDVVVGKAANRTVIFSDEIKHVVFSPYWNIPRSIIRNEILPAMEDNPRYLARHNMEITGKRNGLPVIRQKPGRKNALGRVKFIFPNRYSIYLHDTPAKGLFQRTQRAFSHGCIRVAKPFELAKYLLQDKAGWTDRKIRRAMRANTEQWVALNKKVPVFISYFTSWVDASGQLNFRDDIYGHDKKIAKHLFANK